jgi:hypothetical protein
MTAFYELQQALFLAFYQSRLKSSVFLTFLGGRGVSRSYSFVWYEK